MVVAAVALLLVGHRGGTETDGSVTASAVTARPAGTLVFTFGTNRLMAIDVASGRRTARKVPSVAACGPQMYVTGGHLVFAARQRRRTVVFSVPVALDRPPRRLGAAHAFVPSATEGRVWLAGVDCTRSAMVGAREVTVDGDVTAETDRRIPAAWLAGAVSRGLVLARSRELVVWDPETGETGRPLAIQAVTATRGDLLAGCAAGADCSGLVVLDAATGRQVLTRRPIEWDARFSPDGSLLATPARVDRHWRVALVEARSGRTTIVPGIRSRHYPQLSWAASSGWLFVQTGPRRMMAYRPGLSRPVALPFRAPRGAIAYIAG